MEAFVNDNLPLTWIFMHDNDTKHSFIVVQSLLKNNYVEIHDWPT